MISFRDMTFCPYWKECLDGKDCFRALTPQIEASAETWWENSEDGPPICQFTEPPECYKRKE